MRSLVITENFTVIARLKILADLPAERILYCSAVRFAAKGGPSARSGHRMALWKNRLLVFGGFYSAAKDVRHVSLR